MERSFHLLVAVISTFSKASRKKYDLLHTTMVLRICRAWLLPIPMSLLPYSHWGLLGCLKIHFGVHITTWNTTLAALTGYNSLSISLRQAFVCTKLCTHYRLRYGVGCGVVSSTLWHWVITPYRTREYRTATRVHTINYSPPIPHWSCAPHKANYASSPRRQERHDGNMRSTGSTVKYGQYDRNSPSCVRWCNGDVTSENGDRHTWSCRRTLWAQAVGQYAVIRTTSGNVVKHAGRDREETQRNGIFGIVVCFCNTHAVGLKATQFLCRTDVVRKLLESLLASSCVWFTKFIEQFIHFYRRFLIQLNFPDLKTSIFSAVTGTSPTSSSCLWKS